MNKPTQPKAKSAAKSQAKVKDLKPRNEAALKGGIAVNDTGYCGDVTAPKPRPKP